MSEALGPQIHIAAVAVLQFQLLGKVRAQLLHKHTHIRLLALAHYGFYPLQLARAVAVFTVVVAAFASYYHPVDSWQNMKFFCPIINRYLKHLLTKIYWPIKRLQREKAHFYFLHIY